MKRSHSLTICAALAALAAAAYPKSSLADPQGVLTMVELPVENVLAPEVGYDDNDPVQVVLRGTVPDGCHVLADARAERVQGTNVIRVKQLAFKKTSGVCADATKLPDAMKLGARFTTEASVGILEKGDYTIEHVTQQNKKLDRKLSVAAAPVPTVDSLPYASVSQVRVRELVDANQAVSVTLTGLLNSTCVELDQVKVNRVDDVVILLPVLKMKPSGSLCTQVVTPFVRKVDVGQLAPGENLVHVRSMHGRAVNEVIQVAGAQ